jgi:leucine-zipper of insertion element IS481
MEEIFRFVSLVNSGRFCVSELCEDFGISRKTGYKYLDRYEQDGVKELQAKSSRPKHCLHKTARPFSDLVFSVGLRPISPAWFLTYTPTAKGCRLFQEIRQSLCVS